MKSIAFFVIAGVATYYLLKTIKRYNYTKLDPKCTPMAKRGWRTVSTQKGDAVKFKVLSYNILADAYTRGLNVSHYPGKDLAVLQDYNYRSTRVLMEIEQDQAEIICLQEVDHFDTIYGPKLQDMGYETQIVYRRNIDAELIGWKKGVFKMVEKQEINHEDLVPKYGNAYKRGNVGLIC